MERSKLIAIYFTLQAIQKGSMGFIMATYVLFLQAHGQSYLDAGLINSVFFLAMFATEIPTGIFADIYGRRKSYLLACLFRIIDPFVYAMSVSLPGFLLAETLAAFGRTCENGAFTAWFVDGLKHCGGYIDEKDLRKIFSRANMVAAAMTLVATLWGHSAAKVNGDMPWILMGSAGILNFTLALIFMKEEYRPKEKVQIDFKSRWQEAKETFHRGWQYSRRDPKIAFLIGSGAFFVFAVQGINMQSMPFYEWLLGNAADDYLGYVAGGIRVAIFAGLILAGWLARKIGSEKGVIVLCLLVTGLFSAFSAIPFLYGSLLVFYIHEVARGAYEPIRLAYLHDGLPSRDRATLDSFSSTASHIGAVVGLVLSGVLADAFNIATSWVFSGLVLVIYVLLLYRRHGQKIDRKKVETPVPH